MDSNISGVVFDIKRFAIHDGEGIRATLFLKGCSLRCPWCHNPEGRKIDIELMWFASLCVSCGECERACDYNAIIYRNGKTVIDRQKCTTCGDCVQACPTVALKLDGEVMTAKAAFDELLCDHVFFMQKGGVTLSGGDPLFQPQFALAVLQLCKQANVNTTIETCLFAEPKVVEQFMQLVDHFYVDIKIFDDARHKAVVGVGNKRILQNFEMLCQSGAKVTVRIPLIPGYTDDDDNLKNIAHYVHKTCQDADIELLNYNPLAENKFLTIDEKYQVGHLVKPLKKSVFDEKRIMVSDILEGKYES